ncbi:MAG TPA: Ig-like domain-containing protein, partial [bacterium]|nr:Ig-like domain-containing protein [bacterium]
MFHVDRWAFLVAVFAVLALTAAPLIGCGDDDDDDDDDDAADDDDGDDDNDTGDDDDDDDTTDDDTGDDDDDWVEITPGAQMIPVGTSFTFTAAGEVDGVTATTFTWSIGDDEVATVVDGVVTAVASGQATLTVTAGDASAEALIAVGPDVYSFDNLNGVATAIDRGDESAIADLAGGSIGAVLQNVTIDTENGLLYYVDSADSGAGVTGNEKLIMVDLLDEYATTDIALNQDSPWAATVFFDAVWVTGNLDDTLAKVTV